MAKNIIIAVILCVITAFFFYGDTGAERSLFCCSRGRISPLYYFLGVPVVVVGGYRIVTDYLVTKYDEKALRDQSTGILYGAESMDLGSENSPGAVLLIHGFVGAANNFNVLPERLAEQGWHVRVMRVPGHGTSPRDLEKETPDTIIRTVRAELDSLCRFHETVVLVGHSMGGTLALLAAAETEVDGVVLAAPFFGVAHKWYYILTPEIWSSIAYPFIRWVRRSDFFIQVNRAEAKEEIVAYGWVPIHGIKTLIEIGRRAKEPEVLDRITCPVLLLQSRGDYAASWKDSERAFENLKSPDKQIIWLEKSNHHIFWDYEFDKVTAEIVKFLERL